MQLRSRLAALLPAAVRDELRAVLECPPTSRSAYLRLLLTGGFSRRQRRPLPVNAGSRVLFVCYGNILRSAFAEVYFRSRVANDHSGAEIASAGTHARDGRAADDRGIRVAGEYGLDLSTHRARRITPELLAWATHIVAMDRHNFAGIVALSPAARQRTILLSDFAGAHDSDAEVADPYSSDESGVRASYARIASLLDRAQPGPARGV